MTQTRPSFKQIIKGVREENANRLFQKARHASWIAKITRSSKSRAQAYAAKDAALNQGIINGLFRTGSGDQCMKGLLLVQHSRVGSLHLPRRRLTKESLDKPTIQALLGLSSPRAITT